MRILTVVTMCAIAAGIAAAPSNLRSEADFLATQTAPVPRGNELSEAMRTFTNRKKAAAGSDKLRATLAAGLTTAIKSGKLTATNANSSSSLDKNLAVVSSSSSGGNMNLAAANTGDVFVSVKVFNNEGCVGEIVEFAIFDIGAFCVEIDGGAQVDGVMYNSLIGQGTSDCSSFVYKLYEASACAGDFVTSSPQKVVFDTTCDGTGLTITGEQGIVFTPITVDDDIFGTPDSYQFVSCGSSKPSNPITKYPQLRQDGYVLSTSCGHTGGRTAATHYYQDVSCQVFPLVTGYSTEGFIAPTEKGDYVDFYIYQCTDCACVGVPFGFTDTLIGCAPDTDDSSLNATTSTYSSFLTSAAASTWVVNAGLAALLAVIACVAI